MLPYVSVIIDMFSERAAVPYMIVHHVHWNKERREGLYMRWPVKFNLAKDNDRISYQYCLPLYSQFPRPLSIPEDDKFVIFM